MSCLRLLLPVLVLIYQFERSTSYEGALAPDYYKETCSMVEEIVQRQVEIAVLKDPRMAASLLRLHFHDCFVMGCDASVLLDDFGGIVSEKQAVPNKNSLRGFKVIDEIKYILEEACPCTVSCADILAIAARDSVALVYYSTPDMPVLGYRSSSNHTPLPLLSIQREVDTDGKRDSLKASFNGANQFIPAPNSSLETLIANFQQQGLDTGDLVALSGSHTMGKARCLSFRQRIYDDNSEEYLSYHPRDTIFRRILRSICPESGKDDAVTPLDFATPARFDNRYFHNVIQGKGLLQSDNVLVSQDHDGEIREHVWAYASNQELFFASFAKSMIKMGNINVLTGDQGEIRKTCRFVNT
ncbi:hypothetical protein RJ639_006444 [Escallonia herrerae]|uniref:Peroxidase n=1 Tax=Escallonia herrerae TaxID=1293975 RepID=A0AA89AZ87_9ASTE|nr:hypothetical protein RJ639_006444 [Escallonia herrerae]